MGTQEPLWHDTFEDALRSVAEAYGPKKLASELWPEKALTDAHRLLLHCLDAERSEKPSPGQIALIIQRGREVGCHTGMAYLAQIASYAEPQPVEPEDEKARLQREFIEAQQELSRLAKRIDRMGGAE